MKSSSPVLDDPINEQIRDLALQGYGATTIAPKVGLAPATVTRRLQLMRAEGHLPERRPGNNQAIPTEETEAPLPEPPIPSRINPADVGYPQHGTDHDLYAKLEAVEAENAALKHQMAWVGHADVPDVGGLEGGTATVNMSDWHTHDRKHHFRCLNSCIEKTLILLDRFRPRRLNVMLNGDIVPGRGVYKEQDSDAVLPKADDQVAAASIRYLDFHRQMEDAAHGVKAHVRATYGNHDWSRGELLMDRFVFLLRLLGLDNRASYRGKYSIWNVADKGIANVLFTHGYGHSRTSASSPALISDMKDMIIRLQDDYLYSDERRIRRLSHGHTHFRSLGVEHIVDKPFDVTGGFQGFERIRQGWSERPSGWLVYLSPPKSNEIVPMEIIPSAEAFRLDREEDHTLLAENHKIAGDCLMRATQELELRGIAVDYWQQARTHADEAQEAA